MAMNGAYPEVMAFAVLEGPSITPKSPGPQGVMPQFFKSDDDPSIIPQLTEVSLDEVYRRLLHNPSRGGASPYVDVG